MTNKPLFGGRIRAAVVLLALFVMPITPALSPSILNAQGYTYTSPETGKTIGGKFLRYWLDHGSALQLGAPISDEMQEQSETNGQVYKVQYFERAVFEAHPENKPPYDVLLSLLGNFNYKQKYPSGAPGQTPNASAGSVLFKETGKRLGGIFLQYWNTHGSLPQQGFPISDEFTEKSDLNGKTYKVQYFERAVFEYHPENQPPYDVLLSQLGTFRYRDKYQGPTVVVDPSATPRPVSTAAPTITVPAQPTATRDPNVQEVSVQLIEWAIIPAQITVRAGRVRFIVTNNSANEHNFTIRDVAGNVIGATPNFSNAASPQTLEVTLAPGSYVTYCSLPGHELSGQRGVLIVR